MPPPEAIVHFNRGLELLRTSSQDAAIQFALAIKRAQPDNFPEAHAQLGLTYILLGDKERAQQEIDMAFRQDPVNLTASIGIVMLGASNYQYAWEEFKGVGLSGDQTRTHVMFKMLLEGHAKKFCSRVAYLIRNYSAQFGKTTSTIDCINISDRMLQAAHDIEYIDAIPIALPISKQNIYYAVFTAPWSSLKIVGHETKVNELKQKAEGLYELNKPPSSMRKLEEMDPNYNGSGLKGMAVGTTKGFLAMGQYIMGFGFRTILSILRDLLR